VIGTVRMPAIHHTQLNTLPALVGKSARPVSLALRKTNTTRNVFDRVLADGNVQLLVQHPRHPLVVKHHRRRRLARVAEQ
jgi:hypothetical protein